MMISSFRGVLRTDIGECRIAFATEKVEKVTAQIITNEASISIFQCLNIFTKHLPNFTNNDH